jgi:hypothetical protein
VRWTKKSGKGTTAWKTACEKANMKVRKLYKPIPTRFGNLVLMFRQLLKYRAAVSLLIMDNPAELCGKEPSALEWTVVQEFILLCEPIFKICMINQSREGWTITHALHSVMKCLEHLMAWSKGESYLVNQGVTPAEVQKFTKEMAAMGYKELKKDLQFLFEFSKAHLLYAFALIIDPRTRELWMDLLMKEGGNCNPFPEYHRQLKIVMRRLREAKLGNYEQNSIRSKYHNFAGETALEGVEKEVASQLARFVEEKCDLLPGDSSARFFEWLYSRQGRFPEIVEVAEAVFTIAGKLQ